MNPHSIPISLYLHFPWCVSRCHYCDFNAHQKPTTIPENQYLTALKNQLRIIENLKTKHNDQRNKLNSIFIGGGTPSLVSADLIAQSLEEIAKIFDFKDAEITIEVNPESITHQKLKNYKHSSINRISIGVQSFDSNQLKNLTRAHKVQGAKKAIEMGLNYFENINVDLMYGLIEQTEKQAMVDLTTLLKYPIEHISYYELTLEPNTPFFHFPPKLSDQKTQMKIQKSAIELMKNFGFNRYEISAYAKNNKQCQHNLNYWQFGDYWAVGAGAAAKISYLDTQGDFQYYRYQAPKNPLQFINWGKTVPSDKSLNLEVIKKQDRAFEFFLNSCRLIDGFESSLLFERSGIQIATIQNELENLLHLGLIKAMKSFDENFLIKPSQKGLNYLNEIPKQFLAS